jgi:hypothetical protein
MKKLMLPLATALLFAVAAFAQTSTAPSQNTDQNQPAAGQGSTPLNQGNPQDAEGNQTAATTPNHHMKNEMKGCVEQQNGQYVLQTKRGKDVALTGSDVSAHVGHTVVVHGGWAASAGTETSTNGQMSAASNHAFNVTSVDMVSDTCQMKSKSKSNSGMGSSTQPQ